METSIGSRQPSAGVPTIALPVRVSRQVLRNGKTVHPSKIVTSTIRKPRTQKLTRIPSIAKDLSSLSLSDSKENLPFMPSKFQSKADLSQVKYKKDVFKTNACNFNNNKKRTDKVIKAAVPSCIKKQPTTPERTTLFSNNDLKKNEEKKEVATQLLHPDWRRVPWQQHFGWTTAHQQLYEQLKIEVGRAAKEGRLASIYYSSAEEHRKCSSGEGRLGGPSVSSVCQALEVIQTNAKRLEKKVFGRHPLVNAAHEDFV